MSLIQKRRRVQYWLLFLISSAGLLGTGCLSTEQQVTSILGPLIIATRPASPDDVDPEVEVEEIETDSQPTETSNSPPVELTK